MRNTLAAQSRDSGCNSPKFYISGGTAETSSIAVGAGTPCCDFVDEAGRYFFSPQLWERDGDLQREDVGIIWLHIGDVGFEQFVNKYFVLIDFFLSWMCLNRRAWP